MNAIIAIIIAGFSFSFYPLLNSMALETTSVLFLGLIVQIMTIVVSLTTLILIQKSPLKTLKTFKSYLSLPIELILIPVLSGIGIYLGALFFMSSLDLMSKIGATLIMESWPLIAMLLTPALIAKKWGDFQMIDFCLIGLAVAGMVCITISENGGQPHSLLGNTSIEGIIGVMFAILSAVCFAWASVSRAHFTHKLPKQFRIDLFGKLNSVGEAVFTYCLTYLFGLPLAILTFFVFDSNPLRFDSTTITLSLVLGICLTITSALYSYALLLAKHPNISLLWYFAPVLATFWLVIFGNSPLTVLLVVGSLLIIFANLILIVISNKRERAEQSL